MTSLGGITVKAAQSWALENLFHACMKCVLALIASCEELGVAMMSMDGIWCHCHPILAAYVSNYPEQALVTRMYNSFFFFFLELKFIVLSIATRHTRGTYMMVHTMDPVQPTTSTNVTLKSICCPPKEADHRNGPSQLAKEWGSARNSL